MGQLVQMTQASIDETSYRLSPMRALDFSF